MYDYFEPKRSLFERGKRDRGQRPLDCTRRMQYVVLEFYVIQSCTRLLFSVRGRERTAPHKSSGARGQEQRVGHVSATVRVRQERKSVTLVTLTLLKRVKFHPLSNKLLGGTIGRSCCLVFFYSE